MSRNSVGYTFAFAAGVCVVCSILVAGSAVALKDRQQANAIADKQKKVLVVAGVVEEGKLSNEAAQTLFDENISARIIDMTADDYADEGVIDLATYDARKAAKDDELSFEVQANSAKVARMPRYQVIYEVKNESGEVDQLILPIHGPGLWSTLYGFISVDTDGQTIRGITFYEHGETPGLGGEVDNPRWKGLWQGRQIYDKEGEVAIRVVKGAAGTPEEDPFRVDGLSGATLTSNGVSQTLEFWLGEEGFGPFLDKTKG